MQARELHLPFPDDSARAESPRHALGERSRLSPAQRDKALSLARAIMPDGKKLRGADERTVRWAEELLEAHGRGIGKTLGSLVDLLDRAAVLRTGRSFHRLSEERQLALVRRWEDDPVMRWPLFVAGLALKMRHFDEPVAYRAFGSPWGNTAKAEPARWERQVTAATEHPEGEIVECDVVVVGTGAGGAVVAAELARRGHAVVLLEEGQLHRRDEFGGSVMDAHTTFYRGKGAVAAVGNCVVPVLMGRLVGGSTAVNTGTCFRTPSWVLEQWCEELGTDELSVARMAPHFDRVEREIGVAATRPEVLGGAARVVARGAEALGWNHYPLLRNAPDCDGQGMCDLGCPTDARRSTNVSYVPAALDRGAVLFTGAHVDRVIVENGRAVGVEARVGQTDRRMKVRARAVVLAGGAIPTPMLLLEQGLCNASDQVGRNLSLHPASAMSGLFDEEIRGFSAVPQGYCVDEFHRDGTLFLGASAPIGLGAMMLLMHGRRLMDAMDSYDRIATFGCMVEDDSRGRVRRGRGGQPLLTYWMNGADVARLQRGLTRVGEMLLAGGATKLFPLVIRRPVLESRADLERFRTMRLAARDFVMTSFHPLGTCRMGRDPRKSVVGLDHEAHELRGLFIVDGSTIPGPPAVNPQITIMAFADRAAGLIDEKLSAS